MRKVSHLFNRLKLANNLLMIQMELEIEHLKKENGLLENKVNNITYVLLENLKYYLRVAIASIICFAVFFLFCSKEDSVSCNLESYYFLKNNFVFT